MAKDPHDASLEALFTNERQVALFNILRIYLTTILSAAVA